VSVMWKSCTRTVASPPSAASNDATARWLTIAGRIELVCQLLRFNPVGDLSESIVAQREADPLLLNLRRKTVVSVEIELQAERTPGCPAIPRVRFGPSR